MASASSSVATAAAAPSSAAAVFVMAGAAASWGLPSETRCEREPGWLEGWIGRGLQRSLGSAGRCRLVVKWATLENHPVDFRGSEDFQAWRKLVGHCFATPPEVEHAEQAVKGF